MIIHELARLSPSHSEGNFLLISTAVTQHPNLYSDVDGDWVSHCILVVLMARHTRNRIRLSRTSKISSWLELSLSRMITKYIM